MKTNQEIFDIVAKHLLTQMARSEFLQIFDHLGNELKVPQMQCAYRGASGRKCAAGVLIPDALYSPLMEGLNIRQSVVHDGLEGVGPDGLGLLGDLQRMHDTHDPHEWEVRLQRVAESWCLTFNAEAYGLPADQS